MSNKFMKIVTPSLSGIWLLAVITFYCAPTAYSHRHHDHGNPSGTKILDVTFTSQKDITIAATMSLPDGDGPYHCIVMAGGTLSHTRDGECLLRNGITRRDAIKRLSDQLNDAGYATLRFDKRGFGKSSKSSGAVTYQDQANDLKAAILFARRKTNVLSVIVAGESAGAYLACLAAKDKLLADGYLFLGGLSSTSPELYAYNFGRLKDWAEQSTENMSWAKQNAFHDLRLGYGYEEMFKSAQVGEATFCFTLDDKEWVMGLERKREELANEPGELYRYIQKPALAIQGELDMNVPLGDHQKAVEIMKEAGNTDASWFTVASADHNFQLSADEAGDRIKERFDFSSFARPYSEEFYIQIISWLKERFPLDIPFDETTKSWGGVQIIYDVTDPSECPGIDTVEGRIGPLMKAAESQAHYIEMIPGQYTPEHAHSSESLIFTVKGKWVLCRAGQRKLMKPGTLYHFGKNIPTGYEVPFDEPAYILIFKSHRSDWDDERFLKYLRWLKGDLERRHREGMNFFLKELDPTHPARVFARKVNPEWEKRLGSIKEQ